MSRQEYWRGLPCPPPEDLPNPGIESRSPSLQADSLSSEPPGKPLVSYSGQEKCPTWPKWLSLLSLSQLGVIFGSFWKRLLLGDAAFFIWGNQDWELAGDYGRHSQKLAYKSFLSSNLIKSFSMPATMQNHTTLLPQNHKYSQELLT